MERFKKAMDKARAERSKGGSDILLMDKISVANDSVGGQNQYTNAVSAVESSQSSVPFTQTRNVKVSQKSLRRNNVISGIGPGLVMDAYKILRTNTMQLLQAHQWHSLAITSTRPGEGKTLTAINLAISMAMMSSNTVLLVDMDLRKPTVHKYLDINPKKAGLSDYLFNESLELKNMLVNLSGISNLVVLPGHKGISNSSEMMLAPRMAKLLEELRRRYPSSLIIFDLPPLLSADDALAFSKYVDAYLMVVEEGKAQEEDLKRARTILNQVNLIGTILNKSKEATTGDYYV